MHPSITSVQRSTTCIRNSRTLVGSLVGPVLGGAIADLTGSYRIPFFVAGAIGLGAFFVTLIMVPEKFVRPEKTERKASMLASARALLGSGGLFAVILVMTLGFPFGVFTAANRERGLR